MAIEYVMVPVPAEHADALRQEVLQMSIRDSMGSWEPDVLIPLYGELSERERELVDLLGDAALANQRLLNETVIQRLGSDRPEVEALVNSINTRAHQRASKWLILAAPGPVDQPESQVLLMTPATAAVLADHHAADPGS